MSDKYDAYFKKYPLKFYIIQFVFGGKTHLGISMPSLRPGEEGRYFRADVPCRENISKGNYQYYAVSRDTTIAEAAEKVDCKICRRRVEVFLRKR